MRLVGGMGSGVGAWVRRSLRRRPPASGCGSLVRSGGAVPFGHGGRTRRGRWPRAQDGAGFAVRIDDLRAAAAAFARLRVDAEGLLAADGLGRQRRDGGPRSRTGRVAGALRRGGRRGVGGRDRRGRDARERSRRSWRAPPTRYLAAEHDATGRLSTQPKGAAGGAKDRPGPPAQPPFGRDGTGPPPPAAPAGGRAGRRERSALRCGRPERKAATGSARRQGRPAARAERAALRADEVPARAADRSQRAGRRPARARAGRRCPTPSPRTTPAASPSGCGRRGRVGPRWRRG